MNDSPNTVASNASPTGMKTSRDAPTSLRRSSGDAVAANRAAGRKRPNSKNSAAKVRKDVANEYEPKELVVSARATSAVDTEPSRLTSALDPAYPNAWRTVRDPRPE